MSGIVAPPVISFGSKPIDILLHKKIKKNSMCNMNEIIIIDLKSETKFDIHLSKCQSDSRRFFYWKYVP